MTLITGKRACEILGISGESLRRLVIRGRLKKHKLRISAGPHAARYEEDDVIALRDQMSRPANAAAGPAITPPRKRRPSAPAARRRELIDFG